MGTGNGNRRRGIRSGNGSRFNIEFVKYIQISNAKIASSSENLNYTML